MVDQVNTTALVTYQSNMKLALQPKGGELIGTCLEGDLSGELAEIDDYFGAADTQTIRERHVPIVPSDAPQDRLWLAKPDPDFYDRLVNKQDQLMAGVSLTGGYVMQGAAAIRRYWNRQWLNGFFGSRQTGKKGTIISTFPAGQIVPYNTGFAAGGTNRMCVEKFFAAREVLGLSNADFTEEEAYILLTPKQITDLLREVQITSNEFSSLGGMMSPDGKKLLRFLGFNIIEMNLADALYATKAPTTESSGGGTVRKNPFWLKSGVYNGYWERLFTNVTMREDLHFETQVYARSAMATTRTQDGLSGYIQNSEA